MFLRACCALCMLSSVLLGQTTLPHSEAETLTGKKTVLPDVVNGHPAIFIVGFTKSSQSQTRAWSRQLSKDYGAETRILRFSIAVLEDVPKLFRGFVTSGIRRGVPKQDQDSFLLLYHDEKAWKQLVAFDRPDDAYVLLIDPAGQIVLQTHGPPESVAYTSIQAKIRELLNSK